MSSSTQRTSSISNHAIVMSGWATSMAPSLNDCHLTSLLMSGNSRAPLCSARKSGLASASLRTVTKHQGGRDHAFTTSMELFRSMAEPAFCRNIYLDLKTTDDQARRLLPADMVHMTIWLIPLGTGARSVSSSNPASLAEFRPLGNEAIVRYMHTSPLPLAQWYTLVD